MWGKSTKTSKKSSKGISWEKAPIIKERIEILKEKLEMDWINPDSIHCYRSYNAQTRAIARIYGLPKIWQSALEITPSYVIEVVSEKFDKLSPRQQDDVLIHELVHIPKNFSGALVPHFRKGKRKFSDKVKYFVVKNRR